MPSYTRISEMPPGLLPDSPFGPLLSLFVAKILLVSSESTSTPASLFPSAKPRKHVNFDYFISPTENHIEPSLYEVLSKDTKIGQYHKDLTSNFGVCGPNTNH